MTEKKVERYYNRELSWLSFNKLVLEQIKDYNLPLFERIKFMAIYASNLDEFYRVRIASYRSLLGVSEKTVNKLGYSPKEILKELKKEIYDLHLVYQNEFYKRILPELEENGIILWQNHRLEQEHIEFLEDFFMKEILPEIQPVLLSRTGDVLSFLQDNVIYLATKMFKKKKPDPDRPYYAVIKIPSKDIQRFIQLPKLNNKHLFFFLEDIIRKNLHILFPGYVIDNSYSIKVSRNADLMIEDEFSGNLLDKLKKSLKQRKTGVPARFLYDKSMPDDLLKVLKLAFNLDESDMTKGGKYLNLNDFFSLPNPLSPYHEIQELKQLSHPVFEKYISILKAVKENDIMLHFPYHSYNYVLRFFNEAALDPRVEEIKTTQYRVATNSAIVNALITAARNGKKVTVFVEMKARFDEESNIHFAQLMKSSGINVISSIPGLKVHSKSALVIRKSNSEKSGFRGYAFLSTGNFNEKTAKQYSDQGFFTCDKKIIKDLEKLFLYLETPVEKFKFKHILVPRFNFKAELIKRINREIQHVKEGREGYFILKLNGLEEQEMIDAVYESSENGVKSDLIIRGICCLRPGLEFSKNVTVTRIVDRFLEHARIFYFHNGGNSEVFISSADLMNRNIHRRIESAIPIFNEEIKQEIIDILKIQLKDNTKAKFLDKNICNVDKKAKAGEEKYRAQIDTYLYLQKKSLMSSF